MRKYETLKTFDVGQSALLLKILILFHLLACVAAYLNSLLAELKVVIIVVVLSSLVFYLKRYREFKKFTLRHDSVENKFAIDWRVTDPNKPYVGIEILPSSVVTPYFVFLHFRLKKRKKKTILIVRDAMNDDAFRNLIVTLKIYSSNKENL